MGHKDWVTLIRMATFKSLSRCRNFADSLLPILNSKSEWAGNRHVPGGCRIFTANTSPVFRSLNHAEQSWAWKRKWRVGHRSFPSSFYTYKPCKAVHHRARMHASSLPSFLGLELDPKQRYLNRVAVAQRLWRHQHGATNSNFQASGSLRESSPPRGVLSFSSGRRVKSLKGEEKAIKTGKETLQTCNSLLLTYLRSTVASCCFHASLCWQRVKKLLHAKVKHLCAGAHVAWM